MIAQMTPTGTGYSVSGMNLPLALTAGQSQLFNVIFAPQSAGISNGNLAIAIAGSGSTVNVTLTGKGLAVGILTPYPSTLNFGSIQVGNSQQLQEILTNSGGTDIVVTQITPTGVGYMIGGVTLPLALAAGQSQTFNVIFVPQSAGTSTGNLDIVNTGSITTVSVPLTGNGLTSGVLTPNPLSLNFGSVQMGNNQQLQEIMTNSGGTAIVVTQITPTGVGYTIGGVTLPLTLAAGQSQPFNVIFAPLSVGTSTGNLAITNTGSIPTVNLPLTGDGLTAGALIPNPASLNFGNVQVGNNQQFSETLTNSGGINVNISQATISGTGFTMSGLNPPLILTPGQRFTFTVIFAPPARGSDTGTISVVSDASNPNLAIPLVGTGIPAPQGQLAATPTIIDFGNVAIGSYGTQIGTLTATTASVTVSSDTLTGAAFALSGLSLPVTIPPGQHVQFTVTFTPQVGGLASGSVSFGSDASNSPTIESLTGTGASVQHRVDLSWDASASNNVLGYNIYRGDKSGGPYSKINSVLNASTIYSDSTVVDGQTYYYVTTAVSVNEESGDTNEMQAVIPGP
jgi:hypothetical protein